VIESNKIKNIGLTLIIALLYFGTGKLSLDFLAGHNIVNLGVFAPEGLALAFALYYGKKVWFGIFIGQFLLALYNGVNLYSTVEISFINATEAMIAIALFHKFKLNKELNTFRDVAGLILMIVFVLQIFSSLLSNLSLLFHGALTQGEFFYSAFSWWFGNVMGQLLFAPFLLLLFLYFKQLNLKEYLLYGIVFGIYLYILEIKLALSNPFLLLSLTIPVLVFVVFSKGRLYGTLMSVVVATVSSYAVYSATGAFYVDSEANNIINYNLFVLAHIVTVFIAGILFEERKRYEEKLHRIIKKEVEKNKKQQLLMLQQNRLAQMGEMINMIAHQWRQPLNHLSLINQTLYYQYLKHGLDEKRINEFIEKSNKTIVQMSATINDFRNFFKPDKKKVPFSINDVIDHTLEITKPMFGDKSINITFKVDKSYKSYGFPNELGQSILNILYNAQDALVEKEVLEKSIKIDLYQKEEHIMVCICDNAGGIPEEIIDKIFDPYFSTKNSKNGTGLGLYISKIIIEEHMGGKLLAVNKEEGACFELFLPSQQETID